MRCVLVGTGSIGQRHARMLRSLVPGLEIVALRSGLGGVVPSGVIDREVDVADAALAAHPDFAIIADPAPCHAASAIPFMRSGVPVFIEKPAAVDGPGMSALLEAGTSCPGALIGYVLRHDPGLACFRHAIRDGAIGEIVMLHLEAGQALVDWRPGQDARRSISARREAGGGVMFELSHEIDSARWILGNLVVRHAMAEFRSVPPLDVEDTAVICLHSENGIPVIVQIDMVRRVAIRQYRAIGTEGTIAWNASAGQVRIETKQGTQLLHNDKQERDDLYRRQMEHFLAVVRGKEAPICTLEDGAKTLALVLEARQHSGLDPAIA